MSTLALLQHYFEYLSSPSVLLVIILVVGPIYLDIFAKWKLESKSGAAGPQKGIPGCFRLGLSKRSNLDDQYKPRGEPPDATGPKIKALFTYPVKSCRGVELAASEVGPTGLKYDRLFTFAQLVSSPSKSGESSSSNGVDDVSGDWKHEWQFLTQREIPRLALIETELWVPDPRKAKKFLDKKAETKSRRKANGDKNADQAGEDQVRDSWVANGGCLILRFPFEPDYNLFGLRTQTVTIRLPLAPTRHRAQAKKYAFEPVKIWLDNPLAINATGEIPEGDLAKLKYFLGVSNPLGIFRVDRKNLRTITRSLPEDRPSDETYEVGFADAFPFHLLSLESVQAQDNELPEKDALKGSLDARRFRANIYVIGSPAYDEDGWKKITVGRSINPQGAKESEKKGTKRRKVVETEGEYHVACRTARCKLPNVDQETGVKDRNEPSTTLNRTRKVDKGAYPHPCLGMQMIPLFEQGILRTGDEVKVLERGEHVYEKMFS